jgi:hypothetical protein
MEWAALAMNSGQATKPVDNIQNSDFRSSIGVLTYLQQESSAATDFRLQKRQLAGNISNKLSGYIRGVAGQSRRFDRVVWVQHKILLQRKIRIGRQRLWNWSLQVVKGLEASWKDGTIVRPPRGLSFK